MRKTLRFLLLPAGLCAAAALVCLYQSDALESAPERGTIVAVGIDLGPEGNRPLAQDLAESSPPRDSTTEVRSEDSTAPGKSDDATVVTAVEVDFTRDIRPLLSNHCYACHGPDASKRKAHLRLDEKSSVFGKLPSGLVAVVPGSPEKSELFQRIGSRDEKQRMPPPRHGAALSAEQLGLIRTWIEQGAFWNAHWAFEPIRRPAPPLVKNAGWPRNAVDRFILARLEREGLQPRKETARATLIRRVTLDLIGLPPSLDEIDAFLADTSPQAYERVVNRLLQSPHFGERMAQLWLDWGRYADTGGKNYDLLKIRWPWRDWVIRAFNANMPYDRFSIEQLAGDLLPNPEHEHEPLIATGFNRNAPTDADGDKGDMDKEENRVEVLTDMVNTTSLVWLGLSMNCAQCHDHKYDPISQRHYYQMYAFFNRQDTPQRLEFDRFGNVPPVLDTTYGTDYANVRDPLSAMVMRDVERKRDTFVLVRGDFKKKGEKVFPGVLPFLRTPLVGEHRRDRLGLAQWLFHPQNPLTSRVMVNRLWEMAFGTGIVKTSENLGAQGDVPSHPELLDWLAGDFMDRGWDVKGMLRLLVTSAVYRQSSEAGADLVAGDPEDRLLARYPRVRLTAETIRDQALAVAGLLNPQFGGPPVRPILPASEVELYNQVHGGRTDHKPYAHSQGGELHRRSIYLLYKRSLLYPAFSLFDAPAREVCTIRRTRSNTPLQALLLLNEPTYLMAAKSLAQRALVAGGSTVDDKLRFAFRVCTCRLPSAKETQVLKDYFAQQSLDFQNRPIAARELLESIPSPLPAGDNVTELAAWVMTSNLLLNLDEVIAKD